MKRTFRRAFTLVEMLLVIAIISILAAMVISNFSNAAQDSRDVVARQQLAVVQSAVNSWVSREIGRVTTSGTPGRTVASVMTTYNSANTVSARFALFSGYLDDGTRAAFSADNGNGRLTSQIMRDAGRYLTLPDWVTGSYPKVQLLP